MSDLIAVEIGCLKQFDEKARNKVELDLDSNKYFERALVLLDDNAVK